MRIACKSQIVSNRHKTRSFGYSEYVEESRYRPRNYCAEPDAFGKAETVQWRETIPEERIKLEAAKLQHVYAVRIRLQLREAERSLAWYADLVGETYDRMTKVLRGVLPMRLDDLAAADLHLDDVSWARRGDDPENPANIESRWKPKTSAPMRAPRRSPAH